MRNHHSPGFSGFGESRGDPFPQQLRNGSTGLVTALLAVLLIAATTATAAAIKNRSHLRAEYAVPMQPMTPFIAKLPGTIGFEEALY
jgi:hypothetical protein